MIADRRSLDLDHRSGSAVWITDGRTGGSDVFDAGQLLRQLTAEESLEKLCCSTSLCYAEQNPGSEVGLSVSDRLHAHGGVLGDPSPSIGAGLLPWSGHGRELSGASLGSLPSAGASVAGSAKPPGCQG